MASWWIPHSGSSASSTSAIRKLVVGPHGELDACCGPRCVRHHPDEVFRPQRLAISQLDVDPGAVLHEPRHLTSAVDRHPQLVDPFGEEALDVVLPQPEAVGVPRGKSLMSNGVPANAATCAVCPSARNRSAIPRWSSTSMVRECRPPARRRGLAGAPLDNGNVDPRQRQLARQHQPCRTSSGDHHRVLGHSHTAT